MTHLLSNAIDIVCWILVVLILGYFGMKAHEKSEDRQALVRRWIISGVLLWMIIIFARLDIPIKVFLIIPPALVLAFIWVPSVTGTLIKPLTSAFDGGDEEVERKPFYFAAEGKCRKGQYQEALADIRRQLEFFPGDYEGYVKLATIQMEQLKSLPDAQATLDEFLNLPDRAARDVVAVLHLLADWQLQYARDAKAAGETLQRIVGLYPGTPFEHAARQRLAHLVSADEAVHARHERKFVVERRERDIGLRKESAPIAEATADPGAMAEGYVKQLEAHPFDTETREQLAILYAEHFGRLDLAADQLEQLIAVPAEPPKHVARWLNLLATLHIKHAHNGEAAEAALRRIGQKFPGGALATVAAERLAALPSELKASERTSVKTLGSYEKNLGLKQSGGY